MCRASHELQKLREVSFEDGDWFIDQEKFIVEMLPDHIVDCELASSCRCFDTQNKNAPVRIWLPNFEQLLKILVDFDLYEMTDNTVVTFELKALKEDLLIRIMAAKFKKRWNELNLSWELINKNVTS